MTLASSGDEAFKAAEGQNFDLIIMDIILGSVSGYDVISRLRRAGNHAPIIILSAIADDCDKVYGLGIGADDYVTKPFSPMVLTAKVKAMLRRAGSETEQNILSFPPFKHNLKEMRFYKNDREISLTTKENLIMRLFMSNPNAVLSMDQIYENVWGNNIVDNNTIMVHIQRLRRKIEDDPQNPKYIRTIRGLGYQFFTG